MALRPIASEPLKPSYDVIVVGGAIIGSASAFFLSTNPDFDGSVLVVERDPSYDLSSTARSSSSIRQQYSNEVNVRISQFAAEFIHDFRARMGGDPEVPEVRIHSFGYLYLADTQEFADHLAECQKIQAALGAGTRILTPEEMAEKWPFYNLDGIVCGSHNPVDEGYFEGYTMFDWMRRTARRNGVEYVTNEVVGISREGDRVTGVTLKSGETVGCGTVVNASGPRAAATARMAGLDIPVEPRKRFSFNFTAETPLDRPLPLTIDPSGVQMRDDLGSYHCGTPPDIDPAVAFDDFEMDHSVWMDKVWPAIATRVPAFERVKVTSEWAGHYAYNTLDQNAVIGPHNVVRNFLFANGFSGHGLQQSPAMGRGISELVAYGEYRELDLSPLGYDRIVRGEPFLEKAII